MDFDRLQAENGLNVNASPWTGPTSQPYMAAPPSQAQSVNPQQVAAGIPPGNSSRSQMLQAISSPPQSVSTASIPQPMYTASAVDYSVERLVCKFFLQGGCSRGAGCSYLHELPRDSMLSAVADSNVTGIVFTTNAKNTFNAMQQGRSSTGDQPVPAPNTPGGMQAGDSGDSPIGYYDAAYSGSYGQVPMWGGGGEYPHDIPGVGPYSQSYAENGGYYNDPIYAPQHTPPPPPGGPSSTSYPQGGIAGYPQPHTQYTTQSLQGGGYGNGALYTGQQHQSGGGSYWGEGNYAPSQGQSMGTSTPPSEPTQHGSRHVFDTHGHHTAAGSMISHHQQIVQSSSPLVQSSMQPQAQAQGYYGQQGQSSHAQSHTNGNQLLSQQHMNSVPQSPPQAQTVQSHGGGYSIASSSSSTPQHSNNSYAHQNGASTLSQQQKQSQRSPVSGNVSAPTRSITLAKQSHWAERKVSPSVTARIDSMLPDIVGVDNGRDAPGASMPPCILGPNGEAVPATIQKILRERPPSSSSLSLVTTATGPKGNAKGSRAESSTGSGGGNTHLPQSKSSMMGSGKGRGYGGHAYHN